VKVVLQDDAKRRRLDVTEDVRRVLDALHGSLDWGSGFLDEEQTASAERLMTLMEFTCSAEYEGGKVIGWIRSDYQYVKVEQSPKNPGGWKAVHEYLSCQRPYGHEGEHGQEE